MKNNDALIKDDEIDLIALIKIIWNERKFIYYCIFFCFFIGILIAVLTPKQYMVTATILPSMDSGNSNVGNLSSLASIAGINVGSGLSGSNSISSDLYPEIVNSYHFLNDFIH